MVPRRVRACGRGAALSAWYYDKLWRAGDNGKRGELIQRRQPSTQRFGAPLETFSGFHDPESQIRGIVTQFDGKGQLVIGVFLVPLLEFEDRELGWDQPQAVFGHAGIYGSQVSQAVTRITKELRQGWLGSFVEIMTAFIVSIVGTGFGIYLGERITRRYLM